MSRLPFVLCGLSLCAFAGGRRPHQPPAPVPLNFFPSAAPLWQQLLAPQPYPQSPVVWVATPVYVPVVVLPAAPPPPPPVVEPPPPAEPTVIRIEVPVQAPLPPPEPPPAPQPAAVVAPVAPPPPEPPKPEVPYVPGNDIYRWVDAEGVQHYSSKVPPSLRGKAVKVGAAHAAAPMKVDDAR